MNRKLFGTDGIRGAANTEPMTAETALRVGMAAARHFIRGDHRHRVVIGKDTRLSGYMIEPALTAGFVSMGMDVILVGPVPTPAVAMLTRSLRADLGVMISASHNPYQDNGIKLFGPDAYKLSDKVEAEIEEAMDAGISADLAPPSRLGRARRLDDAQGRYTEFVKQTFPKGLRLDGLKVVVDCANGAAYKVAPEVLWELGADVVPIGVDPDGFNINQGCGSTDSDVMRSQTTAHGADLGIALDGDADRALIADETGAPDRRRPNDGPDGPPVVGERPAQGRRRGVDGDVQLRAREIPGRPRADLGAHPRRRPLRGRTHAGERLQPGRRAIGPHHPRRLRHHRRRPDRVSPGAGGHRRV